MPSFIQELVLKDWRTFRGRTRIAFHEYAGMSAVLGGNGAGKTSLLDAVAFVTCSKGIKHIRLRDMENESCVSLRLDDGSQFERCGNGQHFFDGELVSAAEYENIVHHKIGTYYFSQLTRPADFLEPRSLARFIECEQLIDVNVPQLESLESFDNLVNDVQIRFTEWKDARNTYLGFSGEVKAANKDLTRLRKSRKYRDKIEELDRRIHLLRYMQLSEGVYEVRNKISALDNGIQSLEDNEARITESIANDEVEIRTNQEHYKVLRHELTVSGRNLGDLKRRTMASLKLIHEMSEDEGALTQVVSKNDFIERSIDALYDQRVNSIKQDLSQLSMGSDRSRGDNNKVNDDCEAFLSIAKRCDSVLRDLDVLRLEADKHAATKSREFFQRMLGDYRVTKHRLEDDFQAVNLKLKTAEFGTDETRTEERVAAHASVNRDDFLEQLKGIDGVLGILHEHVRPHRRYEDALWSVMGEDAQLLLVKDKRAVAKSMKFLSKFPDPLVTGIVNLSAYSPETSEKPDYFRVKELCPQSFVLSAVVDVDDGPYKDKIVELATKGAMLVPDVYDFVENNEDSMPVCTYCDIQGSTRTPGGLLIKYNGPPALAPPNEPFRQSPTTPHSSTVYYEEELYEDGEQNMHSEIVNETGLDLSERAWLSKRISTLKRNIIKLFLSIRKQTEIIEGADRALSTYEQRDHGSSAIASVVERIEMVVKTNLDRASKWNMIQMLGIKQELYSQLSVIRNARKEASEKSDMAFTKLAFLKMALTTEKLLSEDLDIKRHLCIQEMRPTIEYCEGLELKLKEAKHRLSISMQSQSDIRFKDLEPIKQVRSMMNEDLFYLELAREAVMKTIDEVYTGVDDRTRVREEQLEQTEVATVRPEELIQRRTAELATMPATLRSLSDNGVERMKQIVAGYKASRDRANDVQILTLRRFDEATARLEEAKKRRSERVATNLVELNRMASSVYQSIRVGRQAAPRIQRLFLVPLNDAEPWKGVMCALHPVGKQYTPVVQLSNGEMAIAELCIKMAAILSNGTRLVLYDEVDASLDVLTCNALGNFIRKRTGSPGGGQAIMATHRRATYNTAHNLIGVYRVNESAEGQSTTTASDRTEDTDMEASTETGMETGKEADTSNLRHAGPTLVVTTMRRLDREQRYSGALPRPRPQNPNAGLYAS